LVSSYLLWCIRDDGWAGSAIEITVALLFLLWMTNLYNFMDGSNGMAGLQAVFAGLLLAALFAHAGDPEMAVSAALIAACSAGFLPWNLGNAKVFMGDVGSLALGFSLGALLVYGVVTGSFSLPVGLMVMLVFLVDSTLTLLARVLKGERWYNAHKQHLYQRLIAQGWSHGSVVMCYQAVNLALVIPGVFYSAMYPALAWITLLSMSLFLSLGWYLALKRLGALARAG
jgi:Fuc2NAc and GlcNAc transferase